MKNKIVKSEQVENERKKLKTEYRNAYEDKGRNSNNNRNNYNNNRNNNSYNDNRNRNDNQNANKPYAFGSPSVYSKSDIPAYDTNYRKRRF